MRSSRRDFLQSAALAAAIGAWHRPAWSTERVWLPPPTRTLQVIENEWIEMPDGVRLAARIFMPADALAHPVGAVLDYLPYRKRSGTRRRDDLDAAWLVPRGFALLRVDIRGTGESDGVMTDEYDLPEQADAAPLIQWIARQPWCNGKVGMRGASYGAISALQAANKNIPELVAIVPAVGTENGYLDDVHTLSGCIIDENVIWGTIWKSMLINPPDPALVGERWRSIWLTRLEAQIPLVAEWMRHQLVDDYWRARVAIDYSKIKCAVYANGGMADSYVNAVPRLLERLDCPRKGLVGPWGHSFPGNGSPGPSLDWAVEECRWWDRWLNGHDNGIMDEPMLRSYMADGAVAQSFPADTPGRWVSEQAWPAPRIKRTAFFLAADRSLQKDAPRPGSIAVTPYVTVGGGIPLLSPSDMASMAPTEQSPDDAMSLVFETAPLPADLEIMGVPALRVTVTANRPVAKLAARLNEVTPDGRSWLVSYGVLNLAHSHDHSAVAPIVAGVAREGQLDLYYVSRRLHKGSRIRVSISQSQWPIVWPSPEAVDIALLLGDTALVLPVRPRPSREAAMPIPLKRQPIAAATPRSEPAPHLVTAEGPMATRHVRFKAVDARNPKGLEGIGLTVGAGFSADAHMVEGDVNSYRIAFTSDQSSERPGWKVLVRTDATMTSTPTEFVVDEGIEAWHNDEKFFGRRWLNRIKRNGN